MIRVTISYPRMPGVAFDHEYFFNRHLPRLVECVGSAAQRMTVDRGLGVSPWPEASHEVVCSFVCDSREVFERAFFPHIEELQDDMELCGGDAPLIQLSEVVFDQACKAAELPRWTSPRNVRRLASNAPEARVA